MGTRRLPLTLALGFLSAACGGDDDGGGEDPNLCTEMTTPVATIDAYPGEYVGQTIGGGADLSAPEGACADEGLGWYEPVGEDVVVELVNLTPGQLYGVTLESDEDVGYYVVTGCQIANAGPAPGECLAFNDGTDFGEQGAFTAPESGSDSVWVVIDSADLGGMPPETGAFTLRVVEAECTADANTCAAPTPACVDFHCVECGSSFDCDSADEPVCSGENTCEAGYAECTGDDAGDDGAGGNDGPAAATPIDEPTEGNETVVEGSACSTPYDADTMLPLEWDWYSFEVTETGIFGFELEWAGAANDLDLLLWDAAGNLVDDGGVSFGSAPEKIADELLPGTYYVTVWLYDPADQAAAVDYTLTARLAECTNDFECIGQAGAPICSAAVACEAGPAECTGDDAGDDAGGDDGPGGARSLDGGVGVEQTLTGSVCNVPSTEGDYYSVVVTDGQGMVFELSFDDAAADLDLVVFDADGNFMGGTFWVQPEVVTLTYLPAGTYYAQVALYSDSDVTAAVDYSISATKTAAQTCVDVGQCAAEYSTQVFRGTCNADGACEFYEPATPRALGEFCDSSEDCEIACSYLGYEADAEKSVCIDACETDADCEAQGEGLVCTTGGDVNFCTAACADDLECGADTTNGTLTDGEPWHYRTCNVDTGSCGL